MSEDRFILNIIDEFKRIFIESNYEDKIKNMKFDPSSTLITFPVNINGVTDALVYNIKQKKFIELRLHIAKGNIIPSDLLHKKTAWCDDMDIIIIPFSQIF